MSLDNFRKTSYIFRVNFLGLKDIKLITNPNDSIGFKYLWLDDLNSRAISLFSEIAPAFNLSNLRNELFISGLGTSSDSQLDTITFKGEEAGVLALNRFSKYDPYELLFIGLKEKFRGQGIGKHALLASVAYSTLKGAEQFKLKSVKNKTEFYGKYLKRGDGNEFYTNLNKEEMQPLTYEILEKSGISIPSKEI